MYLHLHSYLKFPTKESRKSCFNDKSEKDRKVGVLEDFLSQAMKYVAKYKTSGEACSTVRKSIKRKNSKITTKATRKTTILKAKNNWEDGEPRKSSRRTFCNFVTFFGF